MRSGWLCLTFLVACSHDHAATTPTSSPGSSSQCQPVADHLIALLADDAKGAPPDQVKQVHDLFAEHCNKDAWSPAAQQCFLSTKNKGDADKCANLLTQAQKDSIEHAADKGQPKAKQEGGGGDPCEGGE